MIIISSQIFLLVQPLVYIYVDILHIEGTSCIQPLYLEYLYGLQDPSVS